jgi:hypothetical protein
MAGDINAVLARKKRKRDYTAAIQKKKFDRWLEGHRYFLTALSPHTTEGINIPPIAE